MRSNANRHTRRWLPYAGAVVLVALIIAGLWPQATPVETAHATSGSLRATVNEEGKTRIKHRYTVSTPVTGQLRRIPLKVGDEVRAGQTVLAIVDPLPPALLDARTRALAEARRQAAVANVEKARAARIFAASELRRLDRLYAQQSVSIQDLESARWRDAAAAKDLDSAQSALRQVEAELAEFVANTDDPNPSGRQPTEIKAPTNGRVLRVFEESARVIAAGTPLLELGDPTDLEVVVEALSRDGAALAPGTKMELEQWGGSTPLAAVVRLVEPAGFTKVSALGVEEQRVNVIADLLTPPEERLNLGDNFRVEARIVVWETNQTLKVPSGALFRYSQQWLAFVVTDGRARLRQVKIGCSSPTETQILEGLREGEEVILYPGERVRDGQRVKTITLDAP
jgi:HlyD family secretion protein